MGVCLTVASSVKRSGTNGGCESSAGRENARVGVGVWNASWRAWQLKRISEEARRQRRTELELKKCGDGCVASPTQLAKMQGV